MRHTKYFVSIIILLLISCNAYVVEYNKNNEPILGKNMNYYIIEKPNIENLKKLTPIHIMFKYLKDVITMKVKSITQWF